MSPRRLVIAMDGPAASGKSTTARLVAERLGYLHVDTGAMYRAVTLKVLREGINPADAESVCALLPTTRVELRNAGSLKLVMLDGEDVTSEIRTPEVTAAVSAVSSLKQVRQAMVREQRAMGQDGGIVLEGRDIGTVVFPKADLKFFIVAGIEARAKRRALDMESDGIRPNLKTLEAEIAKRDRLDSTRAESPLLRADDAVEIDTSDMTIEQQVDFVLTAVRAKLEGR